MQLPININEILNGQSVEWARLELKKGWNPEKVIRTLCAFANDFQNLGGGYIVLGVEEKDGLPVLPPCGLPLNQIDLIQKELLGLCHKILPHYHPIIAPCKIEDKTVLVIWAIGGQNRPYKAPVSLKKGNHSVNPLVSFLIRGRRRYRDRYLFCHIPFYVRYQNNLPFDPDSDPDSEKKFKKCLGKLRVNRMFTVKV